MTGTGWFMYGVAWIAFINAVFAQARLHRLTKELCEDAKETAVMGMELDGVPTAIVTVIFTVDSHAVASVVNAMDDHADQTEIDNARDYYHAKAARVLAEGPPPE